MTTTTSTTLDVDQLEDCSTPDRGPWHVTLPATNDHAPVPPPPAAGDEAADLREQARHTYLQSVQHGETLTGRALGARFGRGERWGRARINEARQPDPTPGATDRSEPAAAFQQTALAEDPEDLAHTGPTEQAAPSEVVSVGVPEQTGTGAERTGMPLVHAAVPAQLPPPLGPRDQPRAARLVVWSAFLLGIAASIAANVAHAQPAWGPRIAGAFVPLALLLAVECMSRPHWRRAGTWWGLARYGGTGLVALVAAVISYRHMAGLLERYGEDVLNAHLGPLAVDGLMVVAGFALLAINDTHTHDHMRSTR
ncbi:DUF2637 domain-containing protein [Actinopolymorpha singaporensis]